MLGKGGEGECVSRCLRAGEPVCMFDAGERKGRYVFKS